MSEAKSRDRSSFSFSVCSQCRQRISSADTLESRHAVPCGHVLCPSCIGRIEAEQKAGKAVCRSAGCGADLDPVGTFPTATCTQREYRVTGKLAVFGDQGNVGDAPRPTGPLPTCIECGPDPDTGALHAATHECRTCGEGSYLCGPAAALHPRARATRGHATLPLLAGATAAASAAAAAGAADSDAATPKSHCPTHRLPYKRFNATTMRMMCADCFSATTGSVALQTLAEAVDALESKHAVWAAEAAKHKAKLAEFYVTADAYCEGVTKWGEGETERIKAWEEREVKHVQDVAAKSVALVQEVCERRIEVGASLFTQRYGLRASLEEIDQALADRPKEHAQRWASTLLIAAERQRLVELLVRGNIAFPDAGTLMEWIKQLPALETQFGPMPTAAPALTGALAEPTARSARAVLGACRDAIPEISYWASLPDLAKLVRCE